MKIFKAMFRIKNLKKLAQTTALQISLQQDKTKEI
jgi:hypothetical protein